MYFNKLKKSIKYKRLIKLKALAKLKNKVNIGKIMHGIRTKKVNNKSLFFKSLFFKYLKNRKKNLMFYKKKKKKKKFNLTRNKKIADTLKEIEIDRECIIHKHKRDILFKENYKFNKYLNAKKEKRHFLKKYKRKLRRKLYFTFQILPKIEKRYIKKKKKRDLYFKNKKYEPLSKTLGLKFKINVKQPIENKNIFFRRRKYRKYIFLTKETNNILLNFLLIKYYEICEDNGLRGGKLYESDDINIIENVFNLIIDFLLFFEYVKGGIIEEYKGFLNTIIMLIKSSAIRKDNKKVIKYLNIFINFNDVVNEYMNNDYIIVLLNFFLNEGPLQMPYFFSNVLWMNGIVYSLLLAHKKLKFNKAYKRLFIKSFFIKHKKLIYFKKFINLKYIRNMIRRNTINKKKSFFNVELNYLKIKKLKKYIARRKKYMYKYYNKCFSISPIYKELLIHFIFRLKFKFRNINRYKFRNLKYKISVIEVNLVKYIFEHNELLVFLNKEKYIISNLCILSAYYNNIYSKSLLPYYDWISLEYNKYYFFSWFNNSNKMLENSYMFKHYFLNIN